MVKIQIITNNDIPIKKHKISRFDSVDTFDSCDFNIIDLSTKSIWQNMGRSTSESNLEADLSSVERMIRNSKKAKFVYVFPRNVPFYSDASYGKAYLFKTPLRDNIPGIITILYTMIGPLFYSLEYEPNKMVIGDLEVKSDFYFPDYPKESTNLMMAKDSEKVVAFRYKANAYTTLSILTDGVLEGFIKSAFTEPCEEYPSWFGAIKFYDDVNIEELIERKKELIEQEQTEILGLQKHLIENTFFKSILFTNGQDLVNKVFAIIKILLGIDLTGFEDKKREDFSLVINGNHFVGEIKGVNENVNNGHLSELENNKQLYIEDNDICDAKGLLIICHQRKTEPSKRVEVDEKQIQYAKKHDLLIIETTTLLTILEAYFEKTLNVDKLEDVLRNETGILKEQWR